MSVSKASSSERSRVVITGLSIVSPLGNTLDVFKKISLAVFLELSV